MMYHDQGQIATKLLGFNKGVTVTAGLKTVFTTPAHGTAFDIVGQGKADPGGLEYALGSGRGSRLSARACWIRASRRVIHAKGGANVRCFVTVVIFVILHSVSLVMRQQPRLVRRRSDRGVRRPSGSR